MRKWILEIASGLFIILFLYTALSKLSDYEVFAKGLARSGPISNFSHMFAWAIPGIEIVAVILLFIPSLRKAGLYLSTMLMLLFTGYLAYMIYFTPYRPCSCGGVIQSLTWKQHLVFNIFFLLLGIISIILFHKKTPPNNNPISRSKLNTA